MSSYTSLADYRSDPVNYATEIIIGGVLLVVVYVLPIFVLLLAIDCFSTVRITTVIKKDEQQANKVLYDFYGVLLLIVLCLMVYGLYLFHKK